MSMDSKKANLTPELKEIYDRVMNTSAPAKPTATAAPPAPPIPQNPMVASQPQLGAAPQAPAMPPLDTTQNPSPIPPPPAPGPQQAPSMPPIPGMPQVGAMNPAEEALTSTPARPLNDGNAYSMKGKAKDTQPSTGKKKAAISKPILIILGVAFVAIWGIFWAIIFGLIQR